MRSSPKTFCLLQLFPPLRLFALYIPPPVAGTQQHYCCCGGLPPVPRLELLSRPLLDSIKWWEKTAEFKFYNVLQSPTERWDTVAQS